MSAYTVQAAVAVYCYATVTVEADSIEHACHSAIDKANAGQLLQASDRFGNPFVTPIGEGANTGPCSGPVSALPVPDELTEHGPPPLITLGPDCPRGSLEVTRGTVRVRFTDPAATVTTEVSNTPPPPQNKPLVIVRPRPDRAPDVQIRGGKAVVRVMGWDDSEGMSSGA